MAITTQKETFSVQLTGTSEQGPEPGTINGIASVFGSEVQAYVPTFFLPGAFKKSVNDFASRRDQAFPLLWDHNTGEVLGKVTSLAETNRGLEFQAKISNTNLGRDVLTLLRDGALTGVSIGHQVIPDKVTFTQKPDGTETRFVRETKLLEISLTPLPADGAAKVTEVHKQEEAEMQTLKDGIKTLAVETEIQKLTQKVDELFQLVDSLRKIEPTTTEEPHIEPLAQPLPTERNDVDDKIQEMLADLALLETIL